MEPKVSWNVLKLIHDGPEGLPLVASPAVSWLALLAMRCGRQRSHIDYSWGLCRTLFVPICAATLVLFVCISNPSGFQTVEEYRSCKRSGTFEVTLMRIMSVTSLLLVLGRDSPIPPTRYFVGYSPCSQSVKIKVPTLFPDKVTMQTTSEGDISMPRLVFSVGHVFWCGDIVNCIKVYLTMFVMYGVVMTVAPSDRGSMGVVE